MSSSAEAHLSSRRHFIAALTAGAAIGGGTAPALAATTLIADAAGAGPLDRADIEEWQRHVGSDFVVRVDGRSASLTLVAVDPAHSEGRRPPGVARGHAFAAVFDARSGHLEGDRTYAVHHPATGLMPIYFSPAAEGGRIVALFN